MNSNTKKLFIGGSIAAALLLAGALAFASMQMPMVLRVGPNGDTLLRGTIESVSGSSFTVKSWGGDWTVATSASTQFGGVSSGQITQGDFIGVLGNIDQNASFTVDASYIRDWNPVSRSGGSLSITGVSGPVTLAVNQTGTWTIQASDQNNATISYSVLWGDEGYAMAPRTSQPNAFVQTATFTHAYATTGTHIITFYVKDNLGNTATSTLSVSVGRGNNQTTPAIHSMSPPEGSVGTTVTLTGSGFSASNTVVNFGTGFIYPKVSSDNVLTFTVPAELTAGCRPPMMCADWLIKVNPGSYDVSVSNGNGESNTLTFTVTPYVSADSGINGTVSVQTCGGAMPVSGGPACGTPHAPGTPFPLTVTNDASGTQTQVTTDSSGNFTLSLDPGNYTITPSQQEERYGYVGSAHVVVNYGEYATISVPVTLEAP